MRNAWHFYYALNLVFKVVAATSALRCSPLNMALTVIGGKVEIKGIKVEAISKLVKDVVIIVLAGVAI
ncbi:DUF3265 domain-containing protein, partial [Vibrio alginolyticus]|nr:DUF3265 domain-containing protein [Vibrio alginolyticus]MBT0106016.1 DUF3265 domain-containing protein [Vibrio alginolyticus]